MFVKCSCLFCLEIKNEQNFAQTGEIEGYIKGVGLFWVRGIGALKEA